MERLIFTRPLPKHQDRVLDFRQTALNEGVEVIHGGNELESFENYNHWMQHCNNQSQSLALPVGIVPASTYLALTKETGEMVGITNHRHFLNPALLLRGGHIGYAVSVPFRRQGYATEILNWSLSTLKSQGQNPILLTCYSGNKASRVTIEKAGGILDNEVHFDGRSNLRFWFYL